MEKTKKDQKYNSNKIKSPEKGTMNIKKELSIGNLNKTNLNSFMNSNRQNKILSLSIQSNSNFNENPLQKIMSPIVRDQFIKKMGRSPKKSPQRDRYGKVIQPSIKKKPKIPNKLNKSQEKKVVEEEKKETQENLIKNDNDDEFDHEKNLDDDFHSNLEQDENEEGKKEEELIETKKIEIITVQKQKKKKIPPKVELRKLRMKSPIKKTDTSKLIRVLSDESKILISYAGKRIIQMIYENIDKLNSEFFYDRNDISKINISVFNVETFRVVYNFIFEKNLQNKYEIRLTFNSQQYFITSYEYSNVKFEDVFIKRNTIFVEPLKNQEDEIKYTIGLLKSIEKIHPLQLRIKPFYFFLKNTKGESKKRVENSLLIQEFAGFNIPLKNNIEILEISIYVNKLKEYPSIEELEEYFIAYTSYVTKEKQIKKFIFEFIFQDYSIERFNGLLKKIDSNSELKENLKNNLIVLRLVMRNPRKNYLDYYFTYNLKDNLDLNYMIHSLISLKKRVPKMSNLKENVYKLIYKFLKDSNYILLPTTKRRKFGEIEEPEVNEEINNEELKENNKKEDNVDASKNIKEEINIEEIKEKTLLEETKNDETKNKMKKEIKIIGKEKKDDKKLNPNLIKEEVKEKTGEKIEEKQNENLKNNEINVQNVDLKGNSVIDKIEEKLVQVVNKIDDSSKIEEHLKNSEQKDIKKEENKEIKKDDKPQEEKIEKLGTKKDINNEDKSIIKKEEDEKLGKKELSIEEKKEDKSITKKVEKTITKKELKNDETLEKTVLNKQEKKVIENEFKKDDVKEVKNKEKNDTKIEEVTNKTDKDEIKNVKTDVEQKKDLIPTKKQESKNKEISEIKKDDNLKRPVGSKDKKEKSNNLEIGQEESAKGNIINEDSEKLKSVPKESEKSIKKLDQGKPESNLVSNKQSSKVLPKNVENKKSNDKKGEVQETTLKNKENEESKQSKQVSKKEIVNVKNNEKITKEKPNDLKGINNENKVKVKEETKTAPKDQKIPPPQKTTANDKTNSKKK